MEEGGGGGVRMREPIRRKPQAEEGKGTRNKRPLQADPLR